MKAQGFGKMNDWMTMGFFPKSGSDVYWVVSGMESPVDWNFPKMDGFGFPVTILASKIAFCFFFLCLKCMATYPTPESNRKSRLKIGRNCRPPRKGKESSSSPIKFRGNLFVSGRVLVSYLKPLGFWFRCINSKWGRRSWKLGKMKPVKGVQPAMWVSMSWI